MICVPTKSAPARNFASFRRNILQMALKAHFNHKLQNLLFQNDIMSLPETSARKSSILFCLLLNFPAATSQLFCEN